MTTRPRDNTGFIARNNLWTDQQVAAADLVRRQIEELDLQMIRLSWPDQHGLLRGKFLTREAFEAALVNGMEITMAPFFFDTANAIVYNPFSIGGGFNIPELSGSPNVYMVPDPATFNVLPWADKTGWVIADLYLRDGSPFPFAPRNILKKALAELKDEGYEFVAGLEMEWYLTRIIDEDLTRVGKGGPGNPAPPPIVEPVAPGYNYLLEQHLDAIDSVLSPLGRELRGLGLPLRSMDDEWAPSQVETTFDIMVGLQAADLTSLYRSATKQICRRMGYLATFMCKPAIQGFYSSGWHLHSSLTRNGENVFIPKDESEVLSEVGRQYVAGTLEHAAPASVFTTPTINGYRRRRPFSLAPDRATWGFDNRAALMRVLSSGPADLASHVENRVGEPAANPYLYMAAQIVTGLDGIQNKMDPGPIDEDPYTATNRALLPTSLEDSINQLEQSDFFRRSFGDSFVDYLCGMKRSEVNRYNEFVSALPNPEDAVENVTDWEQREYFELF